MSRGGRAEHLALVHVPGRLVHVAEGGEPCHNRKHVHGSNFLVRVDVFPLPVLIHNGDVHVNLHGSRIQFKQAKARG